MGAGRIGHAEAMLRAALAGACPDNVMIEVALEGLAKEEGDMSPLFGSDPGVDKSPES